MNCLYRVTNLLNNKIYVGVHRTDNVDDGYMGSGKAISAAISAAIKKYGVENFSKEIIGIFDTYDDALDAEAEIVTEEFVLRTDTYNLKIGGRGGFDHINKSPQSLEYKKKGGKAGNLKCRLNKTGSYSPDFISTFSNKALQAELNERAQTNEARAKRIASFTSIGHQQGSKNSQFGKMWITNGIENTKIDKNLTPPAGWYKGRVLKNSV